MLYASAEGRSSLRMVLHAGAEGKSSLRTLLHGRAEAREALRTALHACSEPLEAYETALYACAEYFLKKCVTFKRFKTFVIIEFENKYVRAHLVTRLFTGQINLYNKRYRFIGANFLIIIKIKEVLYGTHVTICRFG